MIRAVSIFFPITISKQQDVVCVSGDRPVRGSTPVFEFVDPDIQVSLFQFLMLRIIK